MLREKKAKSVAKKIRKVPNGPVRNKERTKQKFLAAVGKIFSKNGYTGLNVKKISEVAKVDRKLLYLYFGSLDNLLEVYFSKKDFWDPSYNQFLSTILEDRKSIGEQDIFTILKGQLEDILHNEEFQKAIHWEISEKSDIMRKVSDEREAVGQRLFQLTEDRFKGIDVDIAATLALQVGGIYYISLHSKINGSTFCGIDINTSEGKLRIEAALKQIVANLFRKRKKKK